MYSDSSEGVAKLEKAAFSSFATPSLNLRIDGTPAYDKRRNEKYRRDF